MAAIASASFCSGSASSPTQRWLQEEHRREGNSRHCSTVCHMPGRLPTPCLHLPHLDCKNMPSSSREMLLFFPVLSDWVSWYWWLRPCVRMLLYWDSKHLWAPQRWKEVWIRALMLFTIGNLTKEKGSLASDGFSYGWLRMNHYLWSVPLRNFACLFICSPAAGMEGAANRNPLDISLL